jgi:hypothetical protein
MAIACKRRLYQPNRGEKEKGDRAEPADLGVVGLPIVSSECAEKEKGDRVEPAASEWWDA